MLLPHQKYHVYSTPGIYTVYANLKHV